MTRLLASTLLFAAAVATDPIATGTWAITGDVQGYPVTENCVLTQTDATLAGTCTDSGKVARATTGTVADKTITIVHPASTTVTLLLSPSRVRSTTPARSRAR